MVVWIVKNEAYHAVSDTVEYRIEARDNGHFGIVGSAVGIDADEKIRNMNAQAVGALGRHHVVDARLWKSWCGGWYIHEVAHFTSM